MVLRSSTVQPLLALAQAGVTEDREPWAGFWIILLVMASALIAVLYMLFRSKPPSGPRMGE